MLTPDKCTSTWHTKGSSRRKRSLFNGAASPNSTRGLMRSHKQTQSVPYLVTVDPSTQINLEGRVPQISSAGVPCKRRACCFSNGEGSHYLQVQSLSSAGRGSLVVTGRCFFPPRRIDAVRCQEQAAQRDSSCGFQPHLWRESWRC